LPLKASSGLVQQANNLYENGKLTEAIGLYKKASLSGENPAICYFNLGNAYFQLDSIPQSIVYYQATVSLAPDFFRGHLNLAISYYNLDDLGRSIASVKRALEIEPENEKALLLLVPAIADSRPIPKQSLSSNSSFYLTHKGMNLT
jgi:tetratricopeptide (TPR) repeat protein